MENFNEYDCGIYVGTVRGVIASTYCKDSSPTHYEFGEEKSEITALEWGSVDDDIIVGYKSGVVKLFNSSQNKFVKTFKTIEGKGSVVGIGAIQKTFVIARHNGVINLCKKKNADTLSLNLCEDSTLNCMTLSNFSKNLIATGGEKNDLNLWDITSKKCVFKAKSLGHDELNLPIPTSIRGIAFLESETNLVSCATKEGHVLLYDERAQRKPVAKFIEPKASYSAITSTFKEKQCVVGTTRGYIQLIDLRSPAKCVRTYKSFTGGVTSLICDIAAPYVISTSMDRHLRIHNLDSKELLFKKYMKQSLTKVLIKHIVKEESLAEETCKSVEGETAKDEEYEDLFENMEVISERAKKRKSTHPSNGVVKKKI